LGDIRLQISAAFGSACYVEQFQQIGS